MEEFAITILPDQQCIETQGIRYSFEFFRRLGINGFPEGTHFRIEKREDGMVTITRFYPERKED